MEYQGSYKVFCPLLGESYFVEEKYGQEWNDFFREIVLRFTQYVAVKVWRTGDPRETFKLTITNNEAWPDRVQCGGGMVKRSRRKGYGSSFLFFSLMPDWKERVFKTGHYLTREGWLVLSLEPDPKVEFVDEAYVCWVAAQGRGHSLCRKKRWLLRRGDLWAMRDTADNARRELLARSPEVQALGIDVWRKELR